MKNLANWISVFGFITLGSFASASQENLNLDNIQVPPESISSTGQSKIRDHLDIVKQNISHTQTNLNTTQHNLQIIDSEIKDLNQLEEEHTKLKTRYQEYLANATKEDEKNNKAVKDIEEFEKRVKQLTQSAANKGQLTELETAQLERAEREEWKKDAAQKIKKIEELQLSVEKNLKAIAVRKSALTAQLETWKSRNIEYTNLLSKLNQKKKNAERFLATKNKQED